MLGFLHRVAETVGYLPTAGHAARSRQIISRKDFQNARHGRCVCDIEVGDLTMCHFRTQEVGKGLTVHVDVVGVVANASQKPDVFAPLAAGADAAVFGHSLSPLTLFLFGRGDGRNFLTRSCHDRFDDVVVTGAAADVALKVLAHFVLGRLGVVL